MTIFRETQEPSNEQYSPWSVRDLVADFSIEATPKQIAGIDRISDLLPRGTLVYVPFLPGAEFGDTADACTRLMADGMRPVPHLPARAIESRLQLAGWLARFEAAGADTLLLIAGDLQEPRGPYSNTLDLLETGLLERHGFRRVGVAGHPEGHPVADEAELDRALAFKAAYARETGTEMWLVTQFVFSAEAVAPWLDRLHAAGIGLPVRVGVPGPAKLRTLLTYAMQCGVAASARMLNRRPDAAGMLLGRWHPEEILVELARCRGARPDGPFAGIHVFPFGGFLRSAEWFGAVRDGRIDLAGDGAEWDVDPANEAAPA